MFHLICPTYTIGEKNRTVVNTHKVWYIKSLNVWNHFEVKISGRRHEMIPTHGTTSIFYSYSQLS